MRTCVRRMSVRGKKRVRSGKIDRNERFSDTVRDLVEGEDDGGPIFECTWDEIASGRVVP